jgi:hypothetical protein
MLFASALVACSEPSRPTDAASSTDARGDSGAFVDAATDVVACEGGAAAVCDGLCVDLSTSSQHCGACGRSCADGGVCTAGVCAASCGLAGLSCCAGDVCEEGATCTAGRCVANRGPQPVGRDFVSAGGTMSSAGFVLQGTVGQSSQHVQPMRSTNFVLRGGLIGSITNP